MGVILDENEAAYFITSEENSEKLEAGDPSAVEIKCGHHKSRVYRYEEEWLKSEDRKWEDLNPFDSA